MASIVIIDDESGVREILSDTLAFYGHQITQASGGEEGLEAVRRERPDLVFLDLKMPGMNGFQVLEALRGEEATQGIPVIVLTALNDRAQMIEGFRKGANDYITKPFNRDELLARVDAQLRVQRLERVIRESEARYRALFERSADPMVLLDEAGLVVQANDAAVSLISSGPQRLLGTRLMEVLNPDDRAEFEAAVLGAFEGSQIPIFETRLILLEGRPLPVDVDLHPIEVEGRRHLLLHLRDIRWRRAAHVWSEMIFRYIGDAVFITEGRGIILLASRSAAELTGYSRDELMGLDIAQLHPPEAVRQWQEVLPGLTEGEPRVYEGLLRQKDGRMICVEWAIALFFVDGENYLIGVARDLTERKQLEEQLRQAQKMQAVGQLAGGIAHDFNNLLQVILGYCELLLANLPQGDRMHGQVGEIRKAGDKAASLTRQLLAFSRRQVLQPEVLDLNEVVLNMDQALRRLLGERIDLVTILRPGLERVKADPVQIEQVILNLTVNARDAMPEGGRLTVETDDVELDEDYAREHPSVRPGPHVMLAVADTGAGMDAEALSHLFEPFFTTKEQGRGTGLGLATVYGIVTQSGGGISVESEPGKGSTFRIYLPRFEEEEVQAVQPEAALLRLPRGSETILLVDDEDAVRDLVRQMLQLCGYTVLEASGGEEALEVSGRYEGAIHLMVTDVMMPEMNGREVADRLGPLRPDMRVLYMSGYTDDEIVRQGVLGADVAFLQKPFAPEALARKVREVLDENV
jgi:PAS domain S-box-containing protein